MIDLAEFLVNDAKVKLDAGYAVAADMMADRYRDILSVQAPLMPGVSPPMAATRADPGAIPRRVSGMLQSHVDSQQLGLGHWVFGIRGGVGYALTLEYLTGHPFFGITIDAMLPEIISEVSDHLRRG